MVVKAREHLCDRYTAIGYWIHASGKIDSMMLFGGTPFESERRAKQRASELARENTCANEKPVWILMFVSPAPKKDTYVRVPMLWQAGKWIKDHGLKFDMPVSIDSYQLYDFRRWADAKGPLFDAVMKQYREGKLKI